MWVKPTKPPKEKRDDPLYAAIWRIVDLGVAQAFADHPDYLTRHGHDAARESINKRVTGALYGIAKLAKKVK